MLRYLVAAHRVSTLYLGFASLVISDSVIGIYIAGPEVWALFDRVMLSIGQPGCEVDWFSYPPPLHQFPLCFSNKVGINTALNTLRKCKNYQRGYSWINRIRLRRDWGSCFSEAFCIIYLHPALENEACDICTEELQRQDDVKCESWLSWDWK